MIYIKNKTFFALLLIQAAVLSGAEDGQEINRHVVETYVDREAVKRIAETDFGVNFSEHDSGFSSVSIEHRLDSQGYIGFIANTSAQRGRFRRPYGWISRKPLDDRNAFELLEKQALVGNYCKEHLLSRGGESLQGVLDDRSEKLPGLIDQLLKEHEGQDIPAIRVLLQAQKQGIAMSHWQMKTVALWASRTNMEARNDLLPEVDSYLDRSVAVYPSYLFRVHVPVVSR